MASPPTEINSKQHLWKLANVTNFLFEASRAKEKKLSRFNENLSSIKEVHASLWPGVEVPELIRLKMSEGTFTYYVQTSVVLASLVWGMSNTKRSEPTRARTCKILCEVIKMSCYNCGAFDFVSPEATTSWEDMRNNADVNFQPMTTTLSEENLFQPFTQSMLEAMRECWNAEVADRSVNYLDKFIDDSGKVAIEQFIIWPLVFHKPQHVQTWRIKRNLSFLKVVSYTLLTRLCERLERVLLPNLIQYSTQLLANQLGDTDSEDERQDMFLKYYLSEGNQDRKKYRARRRAGISSATTIAKAAGLLYTASESRVEKSKRI